MGVGSQNEGPRGTATRSVGPGALVVSLDFELHWGVRDSTPADGPYAKNLLGARSAIPRILALFERYEVAATWATVGFLFARDRDELLDHAPRCRPNYRDPTLDPYREPLGRGEADDPLHFAPSLVDRIAQTPKQELGSHTYSHFYGLEAGATEAAFEDDLRSAVTLAAARGVTLRSFVWPRNQRNPDYLPLLARAGFVAHRGNEHHWAYEERARDRLRLPQRAFRLLDAMARLSGHHTYRFDQLAVRSGVVDVPSSRFLRPIGPERRLVHGLAMNRVLGSLEHAARTGTLFHLWWHPHNFGVDTDARLADLTRVLEAYRRLRDRHGMASMTMRQAAERALHPA